MSSFLLTLEWLQLSWELEGILQLWDWKLPRMSLSLQNKVFTSSFSCRLHVVSSGLLWLWDASSWSPSTVLASTEWNVSWLMYNSQTTAFRFEARNFTELELLSYKIAKCQSKLMVWVYPKEVSKGHCGLRKRATPQTLDLESKASYLENSNL